MENHLTLSNLNHLQYLVRQESQRTFKDGTPLHSPSLLGYFEELLQNLQSTYNDLTEQLTN
jgi:hypothetical protein